MVISEDMIMMVMAVWNQHMLKVTISLMANMLEATIEQNLADIKLHLCLFKGSMNMGPFFYFQTK